MGGHNCERDRLTTDSRESRRENSVKSPRVYWCWSKVSGLRQDDGQTGSNPQVLINALTGEVELAPGQLSGKATYQELTAKAQLNRRTVRGQSQKC